MSSKKRFKISDEDGIVMGWASIPMNHAVFLQHLDGADKALGELEVGEGTMGHFAHRNYLWKQGQNRDVAARSKGDYVITRVQ